MHTHTGMHAPHAHTYWHACATRTHILACMHAARPHGPVHAPCTAPARCHGMGAHGATTTPAPWLRPGGRPAPLASRLVGSPNSRTQGPPPQPLPLATTQPCRHGLPPSSGWAASLPPVRPHMPHACTRSSPAPPSGGTPPHCPRLHAHGCCHGHLGEPNLTCGQQADQSRQGPTVKCCTQNAPCTHDADGVDLR